MRLNDEFITYEMSGEQTLVPTGKSAEKYHGIVRCNKTAAFIIECLKHETTENDIVSALEENYEGDHEAIAVNVSKTLDTLRTIGALIE